MSLSSQHPLVEQIQSPLLRLPAEIRLMIYDLLFLPRNPPSPTASSYLKVLHQDRYDIYEAQVACYSDTVRLHNRPVVSIRTLDPERSPLPSWLTRRSKYLIRTSRFRSQTKQTTYTLHPGLPHLSSAIALLRTCRMLHRECIAHIYSNYVVDFSTHIEAIVPFLSDLSPIARSHIRHLSFTKRALPYSTEADRSEWKETMRYLASPISCLLIPSLTLSLGVVAGKPGPDGWDDVPRLEKRYFQSLLIKGGNNLMQPQRDCRDELDWAFQLGELRGVKDLRVRAIVEHSPLPESSVMAFWILLSKSIETGFKEWMMETMIQDAAAVGIVANAAVGITAS